MKLDFGSEKQFLDFIKKITRKDKVALVSHNDLDGLVAPFVMSRVVNADLKLFVNYTDLNEKMVDSLKKHKITKVIFTDLYIKEEPFLHALSEFSEVLILDHHLAQKDWNSDKITFIKCEDGYCAGYLCYELCSKIKNLETIDWIVACSCISDYCHVKTAEWLKKVFAKYGDRFEIEGLYVRKSGKIWDLQETLSLALIYFKENVKEVFDSIGEKFGDIGTMSKHAGEVKREIDSLINSFEKKREAFTGGYLYEMDPKFGCSSIVSTILSGKEIDKIIITVRPDHVEDFYHVSVRRQDKKQSMDVFLTNLLKGLKDADGGGHVPAAGGHFVKKDLGEFKKRLGIKI